VDLLALVRKESIAIRRNRGLFLVLLVVLPGALVLGTAVYQQTIPQDVPVGVVAEDDSTTAAELGVVRAGVTFFATPVDYDDRDAAVRALEREEVYMLIVVPGGLTAAGQRANFTVVSDRAMVPFEEPANLTTETLDGRLDGLLPADVSVRQERHNEQRSLSEYLVPSAFVAFLTLYALLFVPGRLRDERLVLDRLRTESTLETVVVSKLLVYGALLALPLGTVQVAAWGLGYRLHVLSPLSVAALGLTFLALAAVGVAVLFAFRLGDAAVYANLGIALALAGLSSYVYPVGFFSTTRREIARALPTHYAAVATRSGMLRDAPATLYADYLGYLLATALVALVAMELSIVAYRRWQ